MTNSTTTSIEREIRIAARPEIVFPYFVEAERMARWIGPAAALDARPGGDLKLAVAGSHPVRGQFVEIDPPHRVVFTWGWEKPEYGVPPGGSRVEIDLTPDGDGTVVRLRHLDLPPGTAGDFGEGWGHYLARLTIVAAGGDPGPDPLAAH